MFYSSPPFTSNSASISRHCADRLLLEAEVDYLEEDSIDIIPIFESWRMSRYHSYLYNFMGSLVLPDILFSIDDDFVRASLQKNFNIFLLWQECHVVL